MSKTIFRCVVCDAISYSIFYCDKCKSKTLKESVYSQSECDEIKDLLACITASHIEICDKVRVWEKKYYSDIEQLRKELKDVFSNVRGNFSSSKIIDSVFDKFCSCRGNPLSTEVEVDGHAPIGRTDHEVYGSRSSQNGDGNSPTLQSSVQHVGNLCKARKCEDIIIAVDELIKRLSDDEKSYYHNHPDKIKEWIMTHLKVKR